MHKNLRIVEHPLAQHCMSYLRSQKTDPARFRVLTRQVTTLMAIEATRDLSTHTVAIHTPLEETTGQILSQEIVVVPILRAGVGMLEPFMELFPTVSVGYIGLERDEETAEANLYYTKFPDLSNRIVLIIDPMLATGGTLVYTLREVYARNPGSVKLLCLVAAPEGVAEVERHYPDQEIYTVALDRELDEKKYIVPGLGDFGDRLFGTA